MVKPGLKGKEDELLDAEGVRAYFGVGPERVVDVQALAGDASDNVPGAPGIGLKTGALLLNEYGDLDPLLPRPGEITQPNRRQTLIDNVDQILTSRRLVMLSRDVPVAAPAGALALRDPDADALLAFLRDMEFTTLTTRIAKVLGVTGAAPACSGRSSLRFFRCRSASLSCCCLR